jgi:hypothetical protein
MIGNHFICEISGSHCGECDVCILGCCTVLSGRSLPMLPNVMVEWLTILLCIREVPGSHLSPDDWLC